MNTWSSGMSPGGLNSVAGGVLGMLGAELPPGVPEEGAFEPDVDVTTLVGELAGLLDPAQEASIQAASMGEMQIEMQMETLRECRMFGSYRDCRSQVDR